MGGVKVRWCDWVKWRSKLRGHPTKGPCQFPSSFGLCSDVKCLPLPLQQNMRCKANQLSHAYCVMPAHHAALLLQCVPSTDVLQREGRAPHIHVRIWQLGQPALPAERRQAAGREPNGGRGVR